jgi:transcriptional regulator EpsA
MQLSPQLPQQLRPPVDIRVLATSKDFVPEKDLAADNDFAAQKDGTIWPPECLNLFQPDSLMLNLDASLRVHTRPHFFGWTQGLLQGLIKHELLICALRDGKPLSFRVDSFSMKTPEPAIFSELFLRDASAASNLIDAWVRRDFRPMICDMENGSPLAGGAFARELERIGATQILVHGTHDVDGQVTSFFTFACAPGTVGPGQDHIAQLTVPFLHAAWVRSQLNVNGRALDKEGSKSSVGGKITTREQEILRWICSGKSNFEIGAILGISPLTVKNHVQKILRKLNVVNRAQAVGKALEMRILSP